MAREAQFWRLGQRIELAEAMPCDKLLLSVVASPVSSPVRECGRVLAAVSRSTSLHLLDLAAGGVVVHYELLAFPPPPRLPLEADLIDMDAPPGLGPAPEHQRGLGLPLLIDALAATIVDRQTLLAATFVAAPGDQQMQQQVAAGDAGRLHLYRLLEGDGVRARLEFLSRVALNNSAADSIDLLWTAGGALLVAECETGWPAAITAYGLDAETLDDADYEGTDLNDDDTATLDETGVGFKFMYTMYEKSRTCTRYTLNALLRTTYLYNYNE